MSSSGSPHATSAPIDIPSRGRGAAGQAHHARPRVIRTFSNSTTDGTECDEDLTGMSAAANFFIPRIKGPSTIQHSFSEGSSPPRAYSPVRPRITAHPFRNDRLALSGPATLARSQSRAATSFAGYEGRTVICAVSEGRGVSPLVGIAIVDIELGQAAMCQISDTQCYVHTVHKIRVHEPSHILFISSTAVPDQKSVLCGVLSEELVGAKMVALPRRYWSETTGLAYIDDLAFREDIDALMVSVVGNFFAVSSLAAAFKYVESEAGVKVAPHSMSIQYEPADDSMMIDVSSIHHLELLQNSTNPRSKHSLFGHLNHTLTPMGARHLRSCILQPSTKKEIIVPRQLAIEELSTMQDLFYDVRNALKQLPDIDKVVSKLIYISPEQKQDGAPMLSERRTMLDCILQIKQFVAAVPILYETLASARSDVLVKGKEQCRPEITENVLQIIDKHIDKDAKYSKTPLDRRYQTIYAIHSGLDPMLDLARKAFAEQQENAYKYVNEFNAEHNFSNEIKYDRARGFYLRFHARDFEEADATHPGLLINATKHRQHMECQTIMLQQINADMKAAENETLIRGAEGISRLARELRTQIPALTRLCQAVGYLDMLASLAHVVSLHDYCRPSISSSLAFEKARHPFVETMDTDFVPNDYYCSPQYTFQIITGANMSGKSTHIKTAAIIQIMAQIGCLVPARDASVPIMKKLFTRISKDDSIEKNLSTFSKEMKEMAFILRNADSKSLVIVDELGRGSSTRDGLAVAIAIAEALIESGARVFFATHYHELAETMEGMPKVVNQHLQTEVTTVGDGETARPELKMLHTVGDGPVAQSDYGIQLAKAVGCPQPFLDRARAVANKFRAEAEAKTKASRGAPAQRRALVTNLKEILLQFGAEDSSCALLRGVQDEFVERMHALEGEGDGRDDDDE